MLFSFWKSQAIVHRRATLKKRRAGLLPAALEFYARLASKVDVHATDLADSVRVTRGDVVQKVEATGTVQPVDSVEVGAQVTGTIKTLGATFNSEVKEGQVLATLDPASLQAEVDQARAGLVHLQAQYQQAQVSLQDATVKLTRAEQLSKEQLIANADYDAAVVARDAAAAAFPLHHAAHVLVVRRTRVEVQQ